MTMSDIWLLIMWVAYAVGSYAVIHWLNKIK